VVLTHIHLDHAGGAGALLAHLPKAQIAVHPRGRAHLVDPSKLIAASRAVYGDAYYARVYGQILPIAAERVIATEDGARLPLGTRALEVLHTPGHALHHQALRDTRTGGIFTGDTFGVSYREFDVAGRAFVLPTTSPTQFDPDQLHASIDRILALAPPAVYLTHYGQLRDVPRLGADLHAAIDQHVAIATRHAAASEAEACIAADLWGWLDAALDAHGVRADAAFRREILGGDITLNAQGLVAWLARRRV
jgi:glyoxylase-like metal-dependent hydrolase (beta-lactamase superfamily II)